MEGLSKKISRSVNRECSLVRIDGDNRRDEGLLITSVQLAGSWLSGKNSLMVTRSGWLHRQSPID